jgi:hypothetical protein
MRFCAQKCLGGELPRGESHPGNYRVGNPSMENYHIAMQPHEGILRDYTIGQADKRQTPPTHLPQNLITSTNNSYGDLHAFLRSEVTGWGILTRGIPVGNPLQEYPHTFTKVRGRILASASEFLRYA